jgi:hypothetical protein
MKKSNRVALLALMIIISGIWMASCTSSKTQIEATKSLPIESQPAEEPTILPTSTPLPPTATPITPVISPSSASGTAELVAPLGSAAIIDGAFSPGEWDDAFSTSLANGGELMIMHNDGYLYLGIRSREMGFGSICTASDDRVSILHSSAGLGTAIFVKDGDDWLRTQQFSYCCWDTTQSVLNSFLGREGWAASVGTKGAPDEMEYQIDMNGGPLTLAVVYVDDFSFESALHWPENLDDDCLGLALQADDPPERLVFFPDTWVTITAEKE